MVHSLVIVHVTPFIKDLTAMCIIYCEFIKAAGETCSLIDSESKILLVLHLLNVGCSRGDLDKIKFIFLPKH